MSEERKISFKAVMGIAGPVILAGLGQNIIAITDTAFLGRLGTDDVALAAGGLATIWYFTFAVIAMGLSSGVQILAARRMGEGNPEGAGRVANTGLTLGMATAVLLFAFIHLGVPYFLRLIISSDAVYQGTKEYMFWRSFDILFLMPAFVLRGFLNGVERNKVVIVSTVVLTTVNVVLDYGLIFGHLGLPAMGIGGAALASSIAQGCGMAVFFVYIRQHRLGQQYQLLRFRRLELGLAKSVASISAPVIFQYLFSMLSFLLFVNLIEKIGESELAASEVIKNTYLIFMSPGWGYTTATSTLVSNAMGRKAFGEIPRIILITGLYNLVTIAVLGSSMLFAPDTVFGIYTDKASLIELCRPITGIMYSALLMYTVSWAYFMAVTGTGATRVSLAIEVANVLAYCTYLLVVWYTMPRTMFNMWTAEWVYMAVPGLLAWLYLRYGRWREIEV